MTGEQVDPFIHLLHINTLNGYVRFISITPFNKTVHMILASHGVKWSSEPGVGKMRIVTEELIQDPLKTIIYTCYIIDNLRLETNGAAIQLIQALVAYSHKIIFDTRGDGRCMLHLFAEIAAAIQSHMEIVLYGPSVENRILSMETVSEIKKTCVRTLSIVHCSATDIMLQGFVNIPSLCSLTLHHVKKHTLMARALIPSMKSSRIESLSISCCDLSEQDISRVTIPMYASRLLDLALYQNTYTFSLQGMLDFLHNATMLRSLRVELPNEDDATWNWIVIKWSQSETLKVVDVELIEHECVNEKLKNLLLSLRLSDTSKQYNISHTLV